MNTRINNLQTVGERIKQRRSQMLVHSHIYYHLDDALVTDIQWQAWANELHGLQLAFGSKIDWYDEEFKDWDGSTGCHLPKDERTVKIAQQLIENRGKYGNAIK